MKNWQIKTFYYNSTPNFGDLLNENIIEHLSGKKVVKAGKYDADLVAIGSVLQGFLCIKQYNYPFYWLFRKMVTKPLHVWGSGFIRKNKKADIFRRNMVFHAVRGKLSLQRIAAAGFETAGVALGDPGLLCSELIETQKKKYKFGIVPHAVDFDDVKFQELKKLPNSIYIDVKQDALKTLEQIAQCEVVISSAMHGLIAADALGIPNLWVKASDKIAGEDYKFADYYSVFDLSITPIPFDLRKEDLKVISQEFIQAKYIVPVQKIAEIVTNLKNCFPAL